MMNPRNKPRPWRALWLIPVAVLAALSIVATGGGGGGEDGFENGDVDPPLNILPTYNFFITNLPDGPAFTAAVGGSMTVLVDFDSLFPGSIDLDVDPNNIVTFLSYIIRSSARVDLTVTNTDISPLAGTFAVIVTEDINAMVDGVPGSGSFNVVTAAETVAVSILSNGVKLSLNGETPIEYTWEEFANLVDDDIQETWQRRAALAASALEFVVDLFLQASDILDELEVVTLNNPVVETCDMFTGSPPTGVLAQGEVIVTWLGSGELSPGDDFAWQFNQCWTEVTGELIDGTINLENYTETVDSVTGTLFEIGFGGLSGEPGGIVYELTVSETEEDQGVFTIPSENVVTVNGGFALIIQSP